jgi:undecaprenyl-diphosphatase
MPKHRTADPADTNVAADAHVTPDLLVRPAAGADRSSIFHRSVPEPDLERRDERRRAPALPIAVLVVTFVALAVAAASSGGPLPGDGSIDASLLRRRHGVARTVADAVSFCASGPVVALAAIAIAAWCAFAHRRRVAALAVLVAPAVGGVVEVVAKSLVGRSRPVTAVLAGESGDGFPSGHVTGFAALTVTMLVVFLPGARRMTPRLRWTWCAIGLLAVVVVMWSRVAIGVHYLSDTVGGALLGATIGLSSMPAIGWIVRRVPRPSSGSLR